MDNINIGNLFPEKLTISFMPETSSCCSSNLLVQKTRTKTVATLDIGEFIAKETIFVCPECGSIFPSRQLQKIVPVLCKFGHNVLVDIGEEAFLHYLGDEKIIQKLSTKKITISPSEVAYLQKKFIVYLSLIHNESSQLIKKTLNSKGGYILHLDGTCDGDSPQLMTGLDEISGFVLHNVKIPTESADSIIPFLEKIKEDYGIPIAIVSDMGKGIANALEKVFKNIPHFLCHFHFLRDIGKDLFDKENDKIRNCLKKHKVATKLRKQANKLKKIIDNNSELTDSFSEDIENGQLSRCDPELTPIVSTYLLIRWALKGKNQGNGYGYPFDCPYVTFLQRLYLLYDQLEVLKKVRLRNKWRDNIPFLRASRNLKTLISDTALRQTLNKIELKIDVFDKFRDAMRITVETTKKGLNDDGETTDIKTIEQEVEKFRNWLINSDLYSQAENYKKMIKQIDQYWKKLFVDPIEVNTPHGKKIIQPQRTNNILERFFRDIKRGYRKKSGTNSMNKKLRTMLAETPLVKNLKNQEYLKIILDGKTTLAERFSEIDENIVRKEMKKAQGDLGAIPAKLRDIINKTDLPEIVAKLFINKVAA